MINTEQILKYIRTQGKDATANEIDKIISEYDKNSLAKVQKARMRYEIWDKKSSINGVLADKIIKSRGYSISNAYMIYVDDNLVYFQDHNPNKAGYEKMTKKEAEKLAVDFIDKKVEENVDYIIISYVINKILSQTKESE